jgi:hypothetical protein
MVETVYEKLVWIEREAEPEVGPEGTSLDFYRSTELPLPPGCEPR